MGDVDGFSDENVVGVPETRLDSSQDWAVCIHADPLVQWDTGHRETPLHLFYVRCYVKVRKKDDLLVGGGDGTEEELREE